MSPSSCGPTAGPSMPSPASSKRRSHRRSPTSSGCPTPMGRWSFRSCGPDRPTRLACAPAPLGFRYLAAATGTGLAPAGAAAPLTPTPRKAMADPVVQRDRGEQKPAGTEQRTPWRVEGARPGETGTPKPPRWQTSRGFWTWLLLLLIVNWLVSSFMLRSPSRTELPYTVFRPQVDAGNVTTVTSTNDAITGDFRSPVHYPAGDQGSDVTRFSTHRPTFANDNLYEALASKNVEVSAKPPAGASLLQQVLLGFGPTLLLVGLFILLARRRLGADLD